MMRLEKNNILYTAGVRFQNCISDYFYLFFFWVCFVSSVDKDRKHGEVSSSISVSSLPAQGLHMEIS